MVIGAALAAALCYAAAMVLQHRSARGADPALSLRPRLLADLARRPLWLAGALANVVGWGLRFVALAFGSLVVVQPVLSSSLLVAMPWSARWQHERVSGREWVGAVAIATGLAVFLVEAHTDNGADRASALRWLVVGGGVGAFALALVALAVRWPTGRRRAVLLAAAGGAVLALVAALTKATAAAARVSVVHVVTTWSPYALVAVGAVGVVVVQSAFNAASLSATLPVLMVVEPLASVAVGVLLFQERIAGNAVNVTLALCGLAATMTGVWIVARAAVLSDGAMTRIVPAARPVFPAADRRRITAMIDRALESGSLTLGDYGRQFEEGFAARHQVPYAVTVSSGTSALEIALRAFGVEGREVIVPANTFFASAAAVVHAGGRPRFADVSAATLALSRSTVEAALTDSTAGVMLVHIGGLITPEVRDIRQLCDERGLFLLEDAAHAHGAAYDGGPAGTFGHAAAFSLYPTKVMTSGEGGLLVTADEHLRDEARVYRDQGKASFLAGGHVRLGAAWRMSEIHAAIGLVQLDRLDEFITNRRRAAEVYDTALADVKGVTPLAMPTACASNYYKYVAMLDASIDRDALKQSMRENHGVSMSGEVYATPLHREPIFAAYADGDFPVAEDVCRRQICLPVHSDMTADEAAYVAACLAQERSTE